MGFSDRQPSKDEEVVQLLDDPIGGRFSGRFNAGHGAPKWNGPVHTRHIYEALGHQMHKALWGALNDHSVFG